MKWKSLTNLITATILSIAYTIVTLMNIIGPLHANDEGKINPLSAITVYSILYWIVALVITWSVYYSLRKKPETLFFTLVIMGITLIIAEVFMWGWTGS